MSGSRPQDQARSSHRRRGSPSAATATLLTRYQAAMRAEVARLLTELEAVRVPEPGLGLTETPAPVLVIDKPNERSSRWELVIKLARELGTEVDPPSPADEGAAPAKRGARARRVRFE